MSLDPVTIVELEQPRCALRFGVGLCTASGSPLCYNTWTTCRARGAYNGTASIRWRFVQDRPGLFAFGDFAAPDHPATNVIPVSGLQVTSAKGSLNAAGVLDGKSPYGIRSRVTVTMSDFPWDDHAGDFYRADRGALPPRNFWAVWMARNAFFGQMFLRIYDGYYGQTLGEMRQRLYSIENISGPNGDGQVTINAMDPLMLAADAKAKFPEAMDVRLTANITAGQTTIRVTTFEAAKLTKAYGNDTVRHMRIGSEILSYTGVSLVEDGVYDLTGCVRGVLNTPAATASYDSACQRVGRYVDTPTWEIGYDLMVNHTPFPAALIDHAAWADEGDTYLPTLRSTITIPAPELVEDLMGECCQQGMFYVWWSEYENTVPMMAVRPPRGEVRQITGQGDILARTVELRRDPESLLTRVFVYYGIKNPLTGFRDPTNYTTVSGRIEAAPEHPNAANGARELSIYARFVNTEAHAVQITQRILSRYADVPRFLTLRLDAKDRELTVGDVCDVQTREIVDTEGRMLDSRWQVIGWEDVKPGEIYLYDLQTYDYIGFFAQWMAEGSPDFEDATADERQSGAWWANDSGVMPDGSPGFLWQ